MSWEKKAEILYEGHDKQHSAIAAGRNIDNSLKTEYTKMGVTYQHFPNDQYLAYFDYQVLKARNLLHNVIKSFLNDRY